MYWKKLKQYVILTVGVPSFEGVKELSIRKADLFNE